MMALNSDACDVLVKSTGWIVLNNVLRYSGATIGVCYSSLIWQFVHVSNTIYRAVILLPKNITIELSYRWGFENIFIIKSREKCYLATETQKV